MDEGASEANEDEGRAESGRRKHAGDDYRPSKSALSAIRHIMSRRDRHIFGQWLEASHRLAPFTHISLAGSRRLSGRGKPDCGVC